MGRLKQTFNFTSKKTTYLYKHYENNCHISLAQINPKASLICQIYYNKLTNPVLILINTTKEHLSPAFLFISGDKDVGRNPTAIGEFYMFLLPLWMIGIIQLFKNYKKYTFLLIGYFVSTLPSISAGTPHAIRMSIQIPFIVASIIIGYQYIQKKFHKINLIFIVFTLIATTTFSLKYMSSTFAAHEKTATFLSFAKKVAVLSHNYAKKIMMYI